jgi:hypothetical protein
MSSSGGQRIHEFAVVPFAVVPVAAEGFDPALWLYRA